MGTHAVLSRTLEDRIADGVFEKSYAALDRSERDVVDPIVSDLWEWSNDPEVHEGCVPADSVTDEPDSVDVDLEEAIALVRREYRAAAPAARPAIERIGKKLAELAE